MCREDENEIMIIEKKLRENNEIDWSERGGGGKGEKGST